MGATDALLLPYPELTEAADGPAAVSRLANATEDYFYDRILPAGITRYVPHHWGITGSTMPTTVQGARDGDTIFHTGLSCGMRLTNGNWRQLAPAEVANDAAKVAISTNFASLLYVGFRARTLDTNRLWEWTGIFWKILDPLPRMSAFSTNDRNVSTSWQLAICDTVRADNWNSYSASTGVYTMPVTGVYRIQGVIGYATNASGYRGAGFQYRTSSGGAWNFISASCCVIPPAGTNTTIASPEFLTVLNAGYQIGLFGYQNAVNPLAQIGTVLGQQCGLTVELVEQTA